MVDQSWSGLDFKESEKAFRLQYLFRLPKQPKETNRIPKRDFRCGIKKCVCLQIPCCTGWPDRMQYTVSRTLKYFWLSGSKYFYAFCMRLGDGGLTGGGQKVNIKKCLHSQTKCQYFLFRIQCYLGITHLISQLSTINFMPSKSYL